MDPTAYLVAGGAIAANKDAREKLWFKLAFPLHALAIGIYRATKEPAKNAGRAILNKMNEKSRLF